MTERLALVCDDHPINRILACTLLKRLGWSVMEADQGEAALALAEQHRFRLALIDISMPGISGEEVCRRLRARPDSDALFIVAYTAHAFPEERAHFLSCGFDDILVKPMDRNHLEALIATL